MKLKEEKIRRFFLIGLIVFFSQSCGNTPIAIEYTFISCGDAELDQVRLAVKGNPTSVSNIQSRRAAIYRLWRLLWRQGMDMSSFDTCANKLIKLSNDQEQLYDIIDQGFNSLEQIITKPSFIEEVEGTKSNLSSSFTDWPVYHGVDGSQNGYSPDLGPETGKVVWRFPKSNGWHASVILKDNKVFTVGAGTDVIAFCLDQNTGKILWKGRTYSDSYYNSVGAKTSPYLSGNKLIVCTRNYYHSFNTETGKREYFTQYFNRGETRNISEPFVHIASNSIITCMDSDTGNMKWFFKPTTGKPTGEPAITNNAVYVTTTRNKCYKIDKQSGSILWTKSFMNQVRGNVSFIGNKVGIGFKNGIFVALSSGSGEELWRFNANKKEPRAYDFFGSATSINNKVYFGGADKFLYCLDIDTGEKLWEFEAEDWIRAKPVIVDNTVFIGDLSGIGYALSVSNNQPELLWKEKISEHGFTADLTGNYQGILFSDRNMMLTSVAPLTGKKQWVHGQIDGAWIEGKFIASGEVSGQQSSPTIVDSVLYIASPDGFVNAIDTETGKEIWKFETKSSCSSTPTVAEGKVFVGQTYNSFGEYFALDKDTGVPVWTSSELGSVWISAAYANRKLFFGNMDGDFFAVDPNTGKKLWSYYTAKGTPNENKSLDAHPGHGWPPGVYCNPVTEGDVVYTGSWSGYYFAFEQETGKLIWRCKTQSEGVKGGLPDSAAPVLHKNYLYVQKGGHSLAAINKFTGIIAWEWKAPTGWLQNGTIAAKENVIFGSTVRHLSTLSYNANIYAFKDFENGGEMLWKYNGGGGVTAPVLTNDKLIFGSAADPFLTCLNPKNGEIIWRTYVGGIMLESVPSIYGNKVFALIKNGYLYAIK